MAVAAYASLVSLLNVIDEFQCHPFPHPVRLHPIMKQFETLEERVRFLIDFLENHSSTKLKEIEDLARDITHFANEAEDAIDIHVEDLIRSKDMSLLNSFNQDMEKAIEKVDSIMEDVPQIAEVEKAMEHPAVPPTASQRPNPSHGKSMMVGFNERLHSVKLMLAEDEPNLQIIPIVGMGGIGKTTLANNVLKDKYIVEHFHVRMFCTISQEYSVKHILQTLLHSWEDKDKVLNNDESDIGLYFYQNLCGKRYLIVLDDVWNSKAWDDLNMFFPDNKNGSRIMLTTRLFDVADSFGSRNSYSMDFLDEGKSLDLFREVAFAQVACCPELEEIGRSIAKSCGGLPLAIVVIAGLLANSKMTREYWELVAKNVNSFVCSDDHYLKILSLSYHNLPMHLKPCFLSLSVFPEDFDIDIPRLIREWVAKGYIKPMKSTSLEEVAEEYLKELSQRNLISIRKKNYFDIRMKRCGIHDSLRELCLRQSHNEQLFRIPQITIAYGDDSDGDNSENKCFLCGKYNVDHIQSKIQRVNFYEVYLGSLSTSLVRPLVCIACRNMYPQLHRSRFVRTQVATEVEFLLPNKLRHLTFDNPGYRNLNLKLCLCPLLWKLQTLIIRIAGGTTYAPSEIWEMPQLRHLMIRFYVVLDYPKVTSGITRKAENLQTLRCAMNLWLTEDVVKKIPNVKELGLVYSGDELSSTFYSLCNLAHLQRLESLWLRSGGLELEKGIAFPKSLKKLRLHDTVFAWEHMEIVGSLPNLQVLELKDSKFGKEWTPIEGQFQQLKSLILKNVDLVRCAAEKIHFPVLESLVLGFMEHLEEIPQGVGEIDTLRYIEVNHCNKLVVESAKAILEEQRESYGNDDLRLNIGNTDNWSVTFDIDDYCGDKSVTELMFF